jgi:hypothetical protein
MAIRDFTVTHARSGKGDDAVAHGCWIVTWTGLLNGDTGKPFFAPDYPDKSFQLLGTLGVGGNVNIEASNEDLAIPANYDIVRDPQGTDVALNAIAMIRQAQSNTHAVRPRVSAGDGSTNLTVVGLFATVARK